MREGHHLIKRVVETLDLGGDDDLFAHDSVAAKSQPDQAKARAPEPARAPELSFGDALRHMLGSTTAGSSG